MRGSCVMMTMELAMRPAVAKQTAATNSAARRILRATVRLQTAGESASAIGLFAMLPFLSIALMVPLMPWVFDRLGVAVAYRCGLGLEGLAILGYALTEQYLLWCALAVIGGVGAAAAWNGTEAMVAHNAPPERRGEAPRVP